MVDEIEDMHSVAQQFYAVAGMAVFIRKGRMKRER